MDDQLQKIESFQYPAAHVAHLNDKQQKALEQFKKICEERGYYTAQPQDGSKHSSHDDETMLRFLRARTFDPEGAFKQFSETEDWRKENRLDEYYDVIDVEEFETTRELYPQWTGRRDKRGMPIFLFEVVALDSKTINKYQESLKHDKSPPLNPNSKTEPRWLRLFSLYESLTRFVLPLCSALKDRPHPETPISQSNNIVDISGVGLRQFWNLKAHMQDASTLATAHYPETLDRIFIIGAPNFFPTVWGWVKRWFDPITVSKIFILAPNEVLPTLSKYIATENIPKKYGGTLDFGWRDRPNLDPVIQKELNWDVPGSDGKPLTTIPRGPNRWRELKTGGVEAVAVGKVNGQRREEVWGRTNVHLAHIHGIERRITETPVNWNKQEEYQSTTGTSTQPTEVGDPELGNPDAEKNVSSDETPVVSAGTPSNAAVPEATGNPVDNDLPTEHVGSSVNSGLLSAGTASAIAAAAGGSTAPSHVETSAARDVQSSAAAVNTPAAAAPAGQEDVAGLDVVTERISMMPIRTASDHPVLRNTAVSTSATEPKPSQ